MADKIEHKRGDAYSISVTLLEDDGVTPIDLTDYTVRSHIRRGDTLIAELEFTAVDLVNGEYKLSIQDTTGWPLGELVSDIEYTDANGDPRSTETYYIDVIRDVTHD